MTSFIHYLKENRKELALNLWFMFIYVMGMAFAGYLALAAVCFIPAKYITPQMQESTTQFAAETHPYSFTDNPVDNLTDAYMMLAASHERTGDIWSEAIDIWIDGYDDQIPPRALVSIYRDGAPINDQFSYSRYWHGYLVVLKPLLLFFNYGEIRYLMSALQLIMLFAACFFIQKKMGGWYALPLIVSYIFMNPASTMTCMQYNAVTLIMLSAVMVTVSRLDFWLLHFFETCLLFCTFGLATSYFDLLTFPILTLGMPLVILLSYRIFRLRDNNFISILVYSVSWAFGYFGMWALKWVYGSFITGRNLFEDAIANANRRSSSYISEIEGSITYLDVLKTNIDQVSIVSIIIAVLVFGMIIYVKPNKKPRKGWNTLGCFLLVSVYPFLWYAFLKNHSYVHSWFTFRSMAVTVYSIGMFTVTWRGFFDNYVFTGDIEKRQRMLMQ